MPTRFLSPHFRRALIATVLLALAITQTLGVLHRTLSGHVSVHQRTASVAAQGGVPLLKALFAGHHDERDCKIFDQLAHSDLAGLDAPAKSMHLPSDTSVVDIHSAWHIAAQSAGFLARGPPPRV